MSTDTDTPRADRPLPDRTDVAVVGAGPTGLALAVTLARAGVRAVVLDRQAQGANTSRAGVVHARTLEVLDELGASAELRRRGIPVPRFSVRDGSRQLLAATFGGLPTPHPYALMVPQYETEDVLLGRLRELGGDVHRPYRVTGVRQDDDGVVLAVEGPDGPTELRAGYAVGADGMHSTVRKAAGIGFAGDSYGQLFALADVTMDWRPGRDEVSLLLDAAGLVVVAPLPGDRFRVVATVDDAPEAPDVAWVQRLLDERTPGAGRVTGLAWSSRFQIHHRVADRYRAGRLFLAGDAAHVHSPAGGQGMNTGIQDGYALGELFGRLLGRDAGSPAPGAAGPGPARAAEGHAGAGADSATLTTAGRAGDDRAVDDRILDAYQTTRRPVALRVVRFTDRMTRLATVRGAVPRATRNALLLAAGRFPAVRTRLATELAELNDR